MPDFEWKKKKRSNTRKYIYGKCNTIIMWYSKILDLFAIFFSFNAHIVN